MSHPQVVRFSQPRIDAGAKPATLRLGSHSLHAADFDVADERWSKRRDQRDGKPGRFPPARGGPVRSEIGPVPYEIDVATVQGDDGLAGGVLQLLRCVVNQAGYPLLPPFRHPFLPFGKIGSFRGPLVGSVGKT
jgi:hypothetical protein